MNKIILGSLVGATLLSMAGLSAAQADTPLAGAYAGIQGGYDIFDFGTNGKGIEGGVYMGYNAPVAEKVLIGGEINLNVTDAKSSIAAAKAKNDYGIAARAGYLVTDNSMLYLRAGYQRALISVDTLGSQHFDGWSLGAGIEAALTDNISARAEFVYNRYNHGLGLHPDQKNMNVGVAYHF